MGLELSHMGEITAINFFTFPAAAQAGATRPLDPQKKPGRKEGKAANKIHSAVQLTKKWIRSTY